ncbi:hypothetical protein FB451DRAFT_1396205 [Mycena latifolia]|nr:hypothetical protein FB451DRAFT_1396205 [Mycena latifolia]
MTSHTGLETCVINDDGVNLTYGGTATLTITPKINNGLLNPEDSITIPPNNSDYNFKFQTETVATVSFKPSDGFVKVTGGTYHACTGSFLVTVTMNDQ